MKFEDNVLRQPSQRPQRTIKGKLRLEERFADEARFIKSWLDNPFITGAVSPSGRFLARMMARYVDPLSTGPIIELGPGTGPVTEALLHRGVAQERLILVEYDAAFCKLLERRFPKARIVQGDAYNLSKTLAGVLSEPAAAVVSSLPLLTKPDATRLALLSDAFSLMDETGSFVQFTYGVTSPIPRKGKYNDRIDLSFTSESSPPVWLNLPPARVWVYKPSVGAHPVPKDLHQELLFRLREGKDRMQHQVKKEIEEARQKLRHKSQVLIDRAAHSKSDHPALVLLRKMAEPGKSRRL